MALLINDNLDALGAEDNLGTVSQEMSTAVNDLSSGLAINSAADNPSGYSIAESLESEIDGYGAAESNAQTAVSVLQTAQGSINQQESILQQANTIATQAANTTTSASSSASNADQQEFTSLISELDQIASSTTYAGVNLLDGSSAALTFQIGPSDSASDAVVVSLVGTSSTSLAVTGLNVTTVAGAEAAMSSVQAAINTLSSAAASIGASQNQIEALSSNVTVAQQNLTSAHANLVDVNVASETSTFTSLDILEQSGISILSQAQQIPQLALKLIQSL
jgi:flagellin